MGKKLKVIAACILFLASCSTLKDKDAITVRNAGQDEIAGFVSKVRPPRGNPESHYLLARYYQDRGMHREAIEQFGKALQIDPAHWRSHNGLGVSYEYVSDHPRAVQSFERAIKANPASHVPLNNLGYSYLVRGNPGAAITLLEKASVLKSGDTRVRNNLGLAYDMKGPADFKLAGHIAKARADFKADRELAAANPVKYAEAAPARPAAVDAAKEPAESAAPEKAPAGQKSNDQPSPAAPAAPEEVSPSPGAIEISNGNGVRWMARDFGAYLKTRGFQVARLTNAKRFNKAHTSIFYVGSYENLARQVSLEIPAGSEVRQVKRLDRPKLKVKVLLGKDLKSKQISREDPI